MRISLLPPLYMKKVRREKIVRVAAMLFVVLNTVLLAGIVFMLPSYLTLTLSQDDVERRLEAQNQSFLRQNVSEIESQIRAINALAARYQKNEASRKPIAPFFLHLASIDSPEINLKTLRLAEDKGGDYVVSLEGDALNRAAFLSYLGRVEQLKEAARVRSPVENLLKESNVNFKLDVVLTKEFYTYVKNP